MNLLVRTVILIIQMSILLYLFFAPSFKGQIDALRLNHTTFILLDRSNNVQTESHSATEAFYGERK